MEMTRHYERHVLWGMAFAFLAFLSAGGIRAQTPEEGRFAVGEFSELSVLYAGFLDTPRERSFVGLLRSAFARVEMIDLEELSQQSAEGFDVVVADWAERFEEGRFVGPQDFENRLGREFTRPVVMVGAIGGRLPEGTKFKHL